MLMDGTSIVEWKLPGLGVGEIELPSQFCDLLAMNLGKSFGSEILLENRKLT